MRKGIIIGFIVLGMLLVAGAAAYAETQSVKISGDVLVQGFGRLGYGLRNTRYADTVPATGDVVNVPPDEVTGLMSIIRLRVDADLTDNVGVVLRLINDRRWDDAGSGANDLDVAVDLAYVDLKQFFYDPLSVRIGRQEIHFGNDMIFGDVSTNRSDFGTPTAMVNIEDWSTRKAFDAVRSTLLYDDWTIDIVGAALSNGTDWALAGDDVYVLGMNAGYDFAKYNALMEGYFWFRNGSLNDGTGALYTGYDLVGANQVDDPGRSKDKLYCIGLRGNVEPIKDLVVNCEVALQGGNFPGSINTNGGASDTGVNRRPGDREALAVQMGFDYTWSNAKYMPNIALWGSYFSGDKATKDDGTYRNWDPMFENQTAGVIANYVYSMTDCFVQEVKGNMLTPIEDLKAYGSYSNYWLAKNLGADQWLAVNAQGTTTLYTVNGRQRHLGQELDLGLTYDYTEDVQLGVLCGWYIPGHVYNDSRTAQLYSASMKVSF